MLFQLASCHSDSREVRQTLATADKPAEETDTLADAHSSLMVILTKLVLLIDLVQE